MDEKASTATCDGVVFDDLYAHGGLTIDGEERNGEWDEVVVLFEEFEPETILSDGQIQDSIFNVPIAIVISEWSVESQQVVLLGNDFEIGKEVVLGSLEGNAEVLQEVK